ncbi:ABC transporter permease, partial [Peptococcaceae bacterium SCADC1_2_3]
MENDFLTPLFLSLRVAVLATALAFIFGIMLAWLFSRKSFWGKEIIETVLIIPLVLPPTVIGFGLLLIIGKHGPLGIFSEVLFQRQIIFTWGAAVIAAAVVAFPLVYQNAKAAFESVDANQERAARTLGAKETEVFFTITLPLSWPGMAVGLILAFARPLGEFGATLIVVGNIPGKTQTIPMALYFAVEEGDNKTALLLTLIVLIISF